MMIGLERLEVFFFAGVCVCFFVLFSGVVRIDSLAFKNFPIIEKKKVFCFFACLLLTVPRSLLERFWKEIFAI